MNFHIHITGGSLHEKIARQKELFPEEVSKCFTYWLFCVRAICEYLDLFSARAKLIAVNVINFSIFTEMQKLILISSFSAQFMFQKQSRLIKYYEPID